MNSGPGDDPSIGQPESDWKRVTVAAGAATLSVPSGMEADVSHNFDSAAQTLTGNGVSLLVDTGPFVDRLDRYEGEAVDVNGHPARIVSFDDAGVQVTAAHFTDLQMTIAVRSDRTSDNRIALAILGSMLVNE